MSGFYMQEAMKENKFVLTEKGYKNTPDQVKSERKIGDPIKGFETRVPRTWIQKGYVVERKIEFRRITDD